MGMRRRFTGSGISTSCWLLMFLFLLVRQYTHADGIELLSDQPILARPAVVARAPQVVQYRLTPSSSRFLAPHDADQPGDPQCVAPPPGCALSCPGGYAGTLDPSDGRVHCLCLCRQPVQPICHTNAPLFCRAEERCTGPNGQIGCLALVGPASHQQLPPAVLPVNVVPLRPSLSIHPLPRPTDKGGMDSAESDPCDGVVCDESPLHQCQLVESDCEKPARACPPVAKCLLNPCPAGTPMRMPPNGVTALCRTDEQCWDGFWCHQIGYNGFGFCCPSPRQTCRNRANVWQKQQSKRGKWHGSRGQIAQPSARSDSDCASPLAKCCFDGCSLSCQIPRGYGDDDEQEERGKDGEEQIVSIVRPTSKPKINKKLLGSECPPVVSGGKVCEEEGMASNKCALDVDCAEGLKCCSDGCSLRCTRISTTLLPAEDEETETVAVDRPRIVEKEMEVVEGECPHWPKDVAQQNCRDEQQKQRRNNECENDFQCPNGQKCCAGPCGARFCQFPSVDGQTECVAQRISARILAELILDKRDIFEPKCDGKGQFKSEQSDGEFTWCVEERGRELEGTRRRSNHFRVCDGERKLCPSTKDDHCTLKCPFGFQFNSAGCPLCRCRDSACHAVQCPGQFVCRLVPRKCRTGSTDGTLTVCSVAECLPNVCVRGEPLEEETTGELVQCDERSGIKCPQGWYCHQLGIGPMGYCCQGHVLQSELLPSSVRCPAVPNLAYKFFGKKWQKENQRSALLGCRLSRECPSGRSCCFDGATTQCMEVGDVEGDGGRRTPDAGGAESHAVSPGPSIPTASCPAALANVSNPGCASNCASDEDCARRSPFLHCCPVGCGLQCRFGPLLSPCVHLLAATLREVDKLARVPASVGRPTVQCTPDGQFRTVQFDVLSGQYWCVDPASGIELVGSRISGSPLSPAAPPDCTLRHFCKFNCSSLGHLGGRCLHGFRLDHRGCPADEQCPCRDPCDDFKCSFPDKEICVLREVECVSGTRHCPPIPICVANFCRQHGLELYRKKACTNSADCAQNRNAVECKFGPNSHDDPDSVGICCASDSIFKENPVVSSSSMDLPSTSSVIVGSRDRTEEPRQGLCPKPNGTKLAETRIGDECPDQCRTDAECTGIQKCCPASQNGCRRCVQPILATNCQNMLSALAALDSSGISHSIPRPTCDHKKGTFTRVQCDDQGWCWCVESASGIPVLGTRRFQPTNGDTFCSMPSPCPVRRCSSSTGLCPLFGPQSDPDGCPLSSECRCRSPCDQLHCPTGQICLLRPRDCVEVASAGQIEANAPSAGGCLPVPICAPSPCGGVLKPLLNPLLMVPRQCLHSGLNQCPRGFQCIGQKRGGKGRGLEPEGICCPTEERRDEAVEEARKEEQVIGGEEKEANLCNLPFDQGNGVEECGTGRTVVRFYHDILQGKCQEFLYAGCGGNSNNFGTMSECERKCTEGESGMQQQQKGGEAEETEQFRIGFLIAQPTSNLESSLRAYLSRTFGISEQQIRAVHVGEPGPQGAEIQFGIVAPDAREKAKRILDTLAAGQFQFPHDGQLLGAESQGWWARREDSEEASGGSSIPLFWVLLSCLSLFVLLLLLLFICCVFLYLRRFPPHSSAIHSSGADSGASFSSPSPRVRALIHHNLSPLRFHHAKDNTAATSPTEVMDAREEGAHAAHAEQARGWASSHSRRTDHLPIHAAPPTSSDSPNAPRQIIAPRILQMNDRSEGEEEEEAEQEEEEEIRKQRRRTREERTEIRTVWRWGT